MLNSYNFLRVNSEEAVIEPKPYTWASSAFVTVSLENLGEDLRSQDEMPFMDSGIETAGANHSRIEWSHWIQEDTLIREIFHREQYYIEGYELLDADFNTLRRWEPRIGHNMNLSGLPSCSINGQIYFIDEDSVEVFDERGGMIVELEELRNAGLRLVPPHTKNCKALAFRDTPHEDPMFGAVLVDVVAGTWGPEFAVHKFSELILYDGGRLLLQQRQEGEIVSGSWGGYADSGDHTNQFSLIDTATGEVLREAELDAPGGALVEEIQCGADTPRAVIAGPRRIWLLDADNLAIVAENEIPFERNYFVFE